MSSCSIEVLGIKERRKIEKNVMWCIIFIVGSTFILRGVLDSWLSEYLLVLQLKTKS